MNDLIRMKKLAGILTEGVMSVPSIGEARGQRTPTIDPVEINSLAGLTHEAAVQRAQEILAASTTSDVKKQYLANQINNSRNTMGVVKLLYDMVLKGEGNGVQGSSYSRKFGEDAALPADENGPNTAQPLVNEEYDHVGFIKQAIADNHPEAMSDDQLKKKVGIETGYGKHPRFDEYFKKAFDSFYGLDINWGDADNEDDGYTDYTMRQGEMGNPDKMSNNESVMENSELDIVINQSVDRLSDMLNSYVDRGQAVSTLVQELQSSGHSEENIKEILNGVNAWFSDGVAGAEDDNDDDGHCYTCSGTGEGQHGDSSCKDCGGSGVIDNSSTDDFDEPQTGYPDDDLYEEEVDEAVDLNNGYDDIQFMNPGDFFPDGADSPVISHVGPSGAKHGDNPVQKKMEVAEAHKELVYNYRKFLKESAKK